MQKLEIEYLNRNGFKPIGDGKSFESWMMDGFKMLDNGFCDKRQRRLVHAQFGEKFEDVEKLGFVVRPVNDSEYDVSMTWCTRKGVELRWHSSTIGGEDLYDLVSQSIVLADVDSIC